MANKKAKKKNVTRTYTMKAPARTGAKAERSGPQEVLSEDWTAGAIAWNKEGNIVILDPRLAQFIREHARDDRELEIGIPAIPTKVQRPGKNQARYDPYPTSDRNITQPIIDPHLNILTLCGCDHLRFRLAAEELALNPPIGPGVMNTTSSDLR